MPTFHIALLECDTPLQPVKERYGSYGNLFKIILNQALVNTQHHVEPVFTSYDVVGAREYPDLEEIDAILLTGSKYDAHADIDWINQLVDFVKKVYTTSDKPLVGICFGHQILGRALGAKVGRNPEGWEVAVSEISLTDKGRKIFGGDSLMLHQMHRDAVFTVPEGMENLGSSGRCPVQGLYKPKRALTLQAHPEFNEVVMENLLHSRHEMGIFNDVMFQEASTRCNNAHDGLRVAAAIWKFLLES